MTKGTTYRYDTHLFSFFE